MTTSSLQRWGGSRPSDPAVSDYPFSRGLDVATYNVVLERIDRRIGHRVEIARRLFFSSRFIDYLVGRHLDPRSWPARFDAIAPGRTWIYVHSSEKGC
jgi:hypothetical protein